jgi:NAD-dependent dihydropyrimidine dehydrogenase PreA subunit
MPTIKVDWTKCNGCGTCIDNCSALVFELQELLDYPDSKKSVPVRADDCILCMTCVTSCPTGAITVEE